jgi:hypothetical protein
MPGVALDQKGVTRRGGGQGRNVGLYWFLLLLVTNYLLRMFSLATSAALVSVRYVSHAFFA